MKIITVVLIAAFFSLGLAYAADNPRLKQLYDEDQADRSNEKGIDWSRLEARDRARQAAALALIRAGSVLTANDHYHAAMVFQHSNSADDNALAYSLAVLAFRIDPAHSKARWLAAAAWDRTLMRKNRPQWYGTQFVRDNGGKWILYQVDEGAVSEDERVQYVGRPLSKAGELLKKMNSE